MSAVKRVFTHSAILSPWRNPFEPGDRFYRRISAISRYVFELNGTQWGELSESVVLIDHDGFTVETEICTTTTETVSIFSFYSDVVNEHFGLRINHAGALNKLKIYSAGYTPNEGSVVVNDGKIHTVKLEYLVSENRFFLYVDNLLDYTVVAGSGFALADSYNVLVCARKDTNIYPVGDYMPGLCPRFSVWTGSGESKQLTLDIPFNERDTDYQRDVSQPVGAELSDIYEGLSVSNLGAYQTPYINTSLDTSKYYIAEMRIDEVISGSIKINTDSNDSAFLTSSGVYRLGFTGSSYGSIQTGVNGFVGSVSLSIREWSGVILQNALPDDWMQIEKKRWWDYWLGVENVFSADVVAGFWQVLQGNVYTIDGTQTSNNDITTDSAMTVGGTYIFTGLCENIVGTFAFRAGPNEILIIESAGFFEVELTAEIVDIVLRAQPGASGTFSKLSVRRKLEIAS